MQSSGESEFSTSSSKGSANIVFGFWPSLLITLAGGIGLISMVADGPRWITYPALLFVVVALYLVIAKSRRKK